MALAASASPGDVRDLRARAAGEAQEGHEGASLLLDKRQPSSEADDPPNVTARLIKASSVYFAGPVFTGIRAANRPPGRRAFARESTETALLVLAFDVVDVHYGRSENDRCEVGARCRGGDHGQHPVSHLHVDSADDDRYRFGVHMNRVLQHWDKSTRNRLTYQIGYGAAVGMLPNGQFC